MTASRATVVGGGIGGATAALALRRNGFDVAVYEQAHEVTEVGAGVTHQTSARGPQCAAFPLPITQPWICDHDGEAVAEPAHV